MEEVTRLFEHDRVEDVELLFDVPFFRLGRKEAVTLFFEASGVDDHVPPGRAPVEVLSQPVDDCQCRCNDRGRDGKYILQPYGVLEKLGSGDGGNKSYQRTENDRP